MRPPRKGFTLVLALALMAGMVLLVIALAAFLQVESRLATTQEAYQPARLNAAIACAPFM